MGVAQGDLRRVLIQPAILRLLIGYISVVARYPGFEAILKQLVTWVDGARLSGNDTLLMSPDMAREIHVPVEVSPVRDQAWSIFLHSKESRRLYLRGLGRCHVVLQANLEVVEHVGLH